MYETTFNNPRNISNKKTWISYKTFVITILILIVLFLLFKNINFSKSTENLTTQENTIWSQISLSGEILANGNYISYTHTLIDTNNKKFWLKSRELDLNQYHWFVELQWVIEKEQSEFFIIEVKYVSWSTVPLTWENFTWEEIKESWIYIQNAWVYFPESITDKYSLLNNWEDGTIQLKNNQTNQQVNISYFKCSTSDSNKNCKQLQQNFTNSADKKFTSSNQDIYYKLSEIKSRYFNNWEFYGYFINWVEEDEVRSISNYLVLPNKYYIEQKFTNNLSLCTDDINSMTQLTKSTLWLDANWLYVNIEWSIQSWTAICKILLDPTLSNGWQKVSFTTKITTTSTTVTPTPATENPLVNNSSNSDLNFNVKQFPINIEKALEFKSTRWHTITLPSPNLSYAWVDLDDDLTVPGIRCSFQMNIVSFPNKPLLQTNPSVKIYECTVKSEISLSNKFISKTIADWRTFIIEIVDPAWKDFADNIIIQ